MKHQGTNSKRLAEGKGKQSMGNAIERLGKNRIGIRATLQYEKVTPFGASGGATTSPKARQSATGLSR
jgi:type II restriction enzyme